MVRQKYKKRSCRYNLLGVMERNLVINQLRERGIKTIDGQAIEDAPYKTLVLELAKSNYREV